MESSAVGHEPLFPITEMSNPLTRDIDKADAKQIVELLMKCDAEMFQEECAGPGACQTIYNESVVQSLVHLAKKVEDILKHPEDGVVVLSGCGTSGRLAHLLATSFNGFLEEKQHKQIYSYIIAGGDKALLTSQESTEDSPQIGAEVLKKLCAEKKQVLFIGISCGLSAPFVAGQLDYCMNNLNVYTPVVIGFNSVNMARNEPIHGWPFTFRQVLERMEEMQKLHRAFIINPIVGPEAVSGSSRLKGGSVTKMLLEIIFLAGHEAFSCNKIIMMEDVLGLMDIYRRAHKITYSQSEKIAFLVQQAGESLRHGGHVYYVGWNTLGVMGIIDASECFPTFSADIEDVRGFINGGYEKLKNSDGDLSSLGPEFCISHFNFLNSVLPHVTNSDVVIFLFSLDDSLCEIEHLAHETEQRTSHLHAVSHGVLRKNIPDGFKNVFLSTTHLSWPAASHTQEGHLLKKLQQELSTKWIVNAVSTGAHIMKGKVYCNHMVDLKVTNSKLFKRAVSMLQTFTKCSSSRGQCALLKAIHNTEELTGSVTNADVTVHTAAARARKRVVPTALVILTRKCSLAEAKSRLDAHPVLREAIEECLTALQSDRPAQKHT